MKKNMWQSLIVGLLVTSSAVAGLVFMHSVRKGITANSYRVWALLPNADGLYTKSRVMIAGIVIGEITSIRLQEGKARLDLRIKNDLPLYRDATISKTALGLLGDQAIVIGQGKDLKHRLKDGDQIKRVVKSGLMASLETAAPKVNRALPNFVRLSKALGDLSAGRRSVGRGSLRDIAESLRAVALALAQNVKQNESKISRIIGSVDKIVGSFAKSSDTQARHIAEILKDIKIVTARARQFSREEKTLRKTLKNILAITKDLKKISHSLSPQSGHIQKTLKHLNKTLASTRKITKKINEGKGTLGRLINDDKLLKKTEKVFMNVNAMVQRISVLKTHIRFRSDYYFQRSNFRNDLQLTIRPGPKRYYTVSLIDDPRGFTTLSRRVIRSTDPRKPAVVNEEEINIEDTFRFSIQLHLRWWLFAIRGGLIENTAGFGVDFLPFKERLKIRAEIFDVGAENNPRLRIFASFNFFRYFTIAGGADDLLNSGSRDFFLGVGFQFNDADLKYVLSLLALR